MVNVRKSEHILTCNNQYYFSPSFLDCTKYTKSLEGPFNFQNKSSIKANEAKLFSYFMYVQYM